MIFTSPDLGEDMDHATPNASSGVAATKKGLQ